MDFERTESIPPIIEEEDRKPPELKTTESSQNPHRILTESSQTSKTKDRKYIDWQGWVKEGRPLPVPGDDLWTRFENNWRGWYRTSVKHSDPEKRAENRFYYECGKEHIEQNVGWGVIPVEHTGSIKYSKPSKWTTTGEKEGEKEYHVQYEIA